MLLFLYLIRRRKRLLILDLNGVLVHREHISKLNGVDKSEAIRKDKIFIWKRPNVDEFLRWCSKHFDVAIWSSVKKHNLDPILETLDIKPVFVWDQSRCVKVTPHPDPNSDKPDCLTKPLHVLWKDPWWYNSANTYIVDDCQYKMKCNPKANVILVSAWNKDTKKDLGLFQLKERLK